MYSYIELSAVIYTVEAVDQTYYKIPCIIMIEDVHGRSLLSSMRLLFESGPTSPNGIYEDEHNDPCR